MTELMSIIRNLVDGEEAHDTLHLPTDLFAENDCGGQGDFFFQQCSSGKFPMIL